MGYSLPMESSMLSVTEKDELKVSGAAVFSKGRDNVVILPTSGVMPENEEKENTVSISAGYGLKKHLAVQGNFMFANEIKEIGKQSFFQQTFSVGTFFKYDHLGGRKGKITNRQFVADSYLGFGYGQVNQNFNPESGFGNLKINYMKAYLHAGISYRWKSYIKASLSTKLVYTNYLHLRQVNDIPNYDLARLNSIRGSDPFLYLEFSPKVNLGNEYASLYFTVTGTPPGDRVIEEPPGRLNLFLIGMEFNATEIHKLIKDKKENKKLNKL